MTKYLVGQEVGAAATGVMGFSQPRSRPVRENAFGNELSDGPYTHVNIQGFSRMSVQVKVTDDGGGDGAATFSLDVTNDDPNEAGAMWHSLDTTTSLDASSNPAGDLLRATDMAFRYARLSWSAAAGTPTLDAVLVAEC